jgi:PKD repeat protein/DNA-binding MarR family transcriptional regulator
MERSRSAALLALLLFGLVGTMVLASAGTQAAGPAQGHATNCSTGLTLELSQAAGPAPLEVSFDLAVYWGIPVSTNWSFGDDSYLNGSGPNYLEPVHVYQALGSMEAIVEVHSGIRSGACSALVVTTPPRLVAAARATPVSGIAPLVVHFSGTASGGSGTFLSANWSFGDGQSEPGFNLTYSYTIPGIYYATFLVVDAAHDSANATVAITVQEWAPPSTSGGVNIGTVSLVTLLAASVAAFVGAVLYVRSHPYPFTSEDGDGELGLEAVPGETEITERELDLEPTPDPFEVEETAIVPTGPRFPPEAYQARFMDLAPRGPEALAGPSDDPRSRPDPDRPKLSQRVILHLYSQPRLGDDEVATTAFTQAGMMEALEVPQSLLSNVLRRLQYSRILVQDVRHVQGSPRRLNVYRLSPKGEQLAERLRRAGEAAKKRGAGPESPPALDGPEN